MTSALAKFAAKNGKKGGIGETLKKHFNAARKKVGDVADDVSSSAKEKLGEAGEAVSKKAGAAKEFAKANPGKTAAGIGAAVLAASGAAYGLSDDDEAPKKKKRPYLED